MEPKNPFPPTLHENVEEFWAPLKASLEKGFQNNPASLYFRVFGGLEGSWLFGEWRDARWTVTLLEKTQDLGGI